MQKDDTVRPLTPRIIKAIEDLQHEEETKRQRIKEAKQPSNPYKQEQKPMFLMDDNTQFEDEDETYVGKNGKPLVSPGQKKSFALIRGEIDLENARKRRELTAEASQKLKDIKKKIMALSKFPMSDIFDD